MDPEEDIIIQNEIENYLASLNRNELHDYIRKIRNKLLYDTDWTTLIDSPLNEEQKNNYKIYRQALRDLPQNINLYNELVWPVKPE